ncbi:MAG: NAD-binding protein, partial [Desulfobacterales bacterium]|nr:NAD-binding protein [Desulfobacterales bacterium]
MQKVWIIGGGKFGLRAAETIGSAGAAADILIVDKDPRRCRKIEDRGFHVVEGDGVEFLKSRLESPRQRQWIVAAAPIHVAYEWMRACLPGSTRVEPQA